MYPAGAQTFVEVRELQKPLCGASRPGHFAGVATVVSKLFHATLPHVRVRRFADVRGSSSASAIGSSNYVPRP